MTAPRRARLGLASALAAASLPLLAGCAGQSLTMMGDPGATPWEITTPGPMDQGPSGDVTAVMGAEVPSLCGSPAGRLEDGVLPPLHASSVATLSPQGTAAPVVVADDIRIAERGKRHDPFIVFGEEGNVVIGAAAVMQCTWAGRVDADRVVVWGDDLSPLGVIELRPLDARGAPSVLSMRIAREVVRVTWEVRRADGSLAATLEGSFRWDGARFQAEGVGETG
ncbi:hypothetical protein USB125703_01081 [Pseudoclavibacter triregionum]|nr:hypothetical protein USB125703_01081 [Pseudoclavibacter triregionum]